MKKIAVLGAAGVLSLAVGVSAFAADFGGGQIGRMTGHHQILSERVAGNIIKPAFAQTAVNSAGSCNSVCEDWSEYCGNYVLESIDNVDDNYADTVNAQAYGNYTDTNGDGVCDNYTDADNDGICDNYAGGYGSGGYGVCGNYADADNDGVCDNYAGGGYGGGNGNGNGNGNGGGHHSGGHGRGGHCW